MQRAVAERVISRIASYADEAGALLDDTHAAYFPRLTKLAHRVGKLALRVGARREVWAHVHLVGHALVPKVSSLAAPEANDPVLVRKLHECADARVRRAHVDDTTHEYNILDEREAFFYTVHTQHARDDMESNTTSTNTSVCLRDTLALPAGSPAQEGAYDASDVLLRALPTVLVAAVWLCFEAWARWRAGHRRCLRLAGLGVGLLAAAGAAVVAWRLIDVLRCAGVVGPAWVVVAPAGVGILCLLLLLVLGVHRPRLAGGAFLLLAAASVFADWALRDAPGLLLDAGVPYLDAAPTMALQQLLLLASATLLTRLPGHRHSLPTPPTAATTPRFLRKTIPPPTASSPSLVVDALSTRMPRARTEAAGGTTGVWSLFA